jgi:hypothetical protein
MKHISPFLMIILAFVIFGTMACLCSFFDQSNPLIFTPDKLPDAQEGLSYDVTISISQNRTPVGSISVSEGTLPPGFELIYIQAESSAKITGIPTQAGSYTFTIRASCFGTNTSGQQGEKQYSIVVSALSQEEQLVFIPDVLPGTRVGNPYEETISIRQNWTPVGDISLSEGLLPPGLELEFVEAEQIARITGTPTQDGTYVFSISTWCFGTNESGQTGNIQYTLVVDP